MSDIRYYSDMFHNLGDLTITLNNALNLLIRSYRTAVSSEEKKQCKKNILDFLTIVLERNERSQPPWMHQLYKNLRGFVDKKGTKRLLDAIYTKIESDEQLSKTDIETLDDLISLVNQEATLAFRKMRRAV